MSESLGSSGPSLSRKPAGLSLMTVFHGPLLGVICGDFFSFMLGGSPRERLMSSGLCVPLSTFLEPESWRVIAIWVGEALERWELLGTTAGPLEARCLRQLHACSGGQIMCPAENGVREPANPTLSVSHSCAPAQSHGQGWAPPGQSTSCPLCGHSGARERKRAGEDGG